MKMLATAVLASLFAAPAFAEDKTTVQYVVEKGVIIHAQMQGQAVDLPVTYAANGSYTMKMGQRLIEGEWRTDGDKVCTKNEVNTQESCFSVPAGKHPGDSFKLTTPAMGEVTLEINK